MTDDVFDNLEKLRHVAAQAIQAHWKVFLVQGIVMMALGLLAVAMPQISTVAIEIFLGWLFFVGGIFRALSALRSRNAPGFRWSLLTGVLAIALGLVLIVKPLQGVLTLTMVLTVLFVVEGAGAILIALEFRKHLHSWRWALLNGVVNLILAYLIWRGWPGTAQWAIGLLAGVSMFFVGLSLLMTAIAARTMRPH